MCTCASTPLARPQSVEPSELQEVSEVSKLLPEDFNDDGILKRGSPSFEIVLREIDPREPFKACTLLRNSMCACVFDTVPWQLKEREQSEAPSWVAESQKGQLRCLRSAGASPGRHSWAERWSWVPWCLK